MVRICVNACTVSVTVTPERNSVEHFRGSFSTNGIKVNNNALKQICFNATNFFNVTCDF